MQAEGPAEKMYPKDGCVDEREKARSNERVQGELIRLVDFGLGIG
jgi:hypothetical protein